jgi:RNA polymerase sigma factor (sigma-70 family)
MATAKLSEMVGRLGRRPPDAPEPDADLLARFVATRDEAAFAELVRRHGPLVFGVCRRVTGNHHLAEDAFQAVFVVLAAKAGSVRPRSALPAWLYGVAYRTALRARAMADRRRRRETPVEVLPEPAADPAEVSDLARVVDEEVARLPETYRLAVVLCELQGRPRKEVARELGVPEGTLSSRLAEARKRLAARLRNRGIALTAAGLSAALARLAPAAVPAGLASRATAAALSPGVASAPVAALASGVARMLLVARLKAAAPALGLLAAGLFVGGLLFAAPAAPAGADPKPAAPAALPRPAPQAAPPKPAGPGRLLVWTETRYVFYTPDGKEAGALPGHPEERVILVDPVLSPDGKRVAFLANEDPPTDNEGNLRRHVFVRTTDGKGDGTKIAITALTLLWAADGKRLVASELLPAKEPKDVGFVTWSIDPDTGEKADLKLPRHAHVFAVMPDGKAFVGAAYDLEQKRVHLARISADGKEVARLTELRTEGPDPRVSPDGGKVLFRDHDPDEKSGKDDHRLLRLFVFDLKAMKRVRLAEVPLNAQVMGYCWSPDGKKVAYTWKQTMPGVPLAVNTDNMNDPKINTETESFLVVADADGRNPKTLTSRKAPSAPTITLGAIDWR